MKKIILLVMSFGVICGLVIGKQINYFVAQSTAVTPAPTPRISTPSQLIIPQLNIHTTIEPVGLDANNRMAVPSTGEVVGWYHYGPRPGESGNAVIDGHLDTPSGPAIFANLSQLKPGDTVTVVDTINQRRQFTVVNSEIYQDSSFPIDLVFGPSTQPNLNLITCRGSYDLLSKNYSHRLVVFTVLSQ